MFASLLDRSAPMSADERPYRLEKGTEGIGSKQAGVADAAGTKGWRPSVEISPKRVRARSGRFFLRSAHFALSGRVLSLQAEDAGRVSLDPPMSRRAAEGRRLKYGGQKRSGATKGASSSLAFK
jgi:hypothetical protein